jgi:IMP dehydrogenase
MNIFDKAVDLHTRWKLRIRNNIKEGIAMDISDIGNDHACDLGAWIYEDGLKYNGLPCFEAMCSSHEHFHRAAAEVAQCGNAGEKTRAMALLGPDGALELHSLTLMELLMVCSKELALLDVDPCPIVKVSDILKEKDDKHVYSIDAGASIRDALKMMVDDNIGLIIVYKNGQFLGVFTERGFVQRVSAQGMISLEEPVGNTIDQKLINVNKDSSLDQCMELMSATHTRHAVVLDAHKVEGIISIADILNEIKTNKNYPYKIDKNLYSVAISGVGKSKPEHKSIDIASIRH